MDPNQAMDVEFELDVRLVTDLTPQANSGCDTNDGCLPSCASSCASRV